MFVTLLIGVFTPETGALAWVNAGHPPPLLIDERGEVRLLQAEAAARPAACWTTKRIPP